MLDPDPRHVSEDEPAPFRQHRAITVLAILAGLAILFLAYIAFAAVSRSPSGAAIPVVSPGASGTPHRDSGVSSGAVAVVPLAAAPTSGTVAPLCKPSPCPTLEPAAVHSVEGTASWFAAPDGQAAAGPGLRQAIGAGWRGTLVRVEANGRSVTVRLTDWCACSNGKVIDLDDGDFAQLEDLSRGLVAVTVSW